MLGPEVCCSSLGDKKILWFKRWGEEVPYRGGDGPRCGQVFGGKDGQVFLSGKGQGVFFSPGNE